MLSPSLSSYYTHFSLSNQHSSVQRGCDRTLLRFYVRQKLFATQIHAAHISAIGTLLLHPPTRGRVCVHLCALACPTIYSFGHAFPFFLHQWDSATIDVYRRFDQYLQFFSLTFIHIMYAFTRPRKLKHWRARARALLHTMDAFYHINKRLVLIPSSVSLFLSLLLFLLSLSPSKVCDWAAPLYRTVCFQATSCFDFPLWLIKFTKKEAQAVALIWDAKASIVCTYTHTHIHA